MAFSETPESGVIGSLSGSGPRLGSFHEFSTSRGVLQFTPLAVVAFHEPCACMLED
jgi:hypothetical protein